MSVEVTVQLPEDIIQRYVRLSKFAQVSKEDLMIQALEESIDVLENEHRLQESIESSEATFAQNGILLDADEVFTSLRNKYFKPNRDLSHK